MARAWSPSAAHVDWGWNTRTDGRTRKLTTNETTEQSLLALSSGTEYAEAILALLRERTERYTMGDSTSVPVDTARRLLEGILYCLSLAERYADPTVVAPLPTEQKRRAGAEQARRLARRAKFLLKEATRMQPPVVNRAFRDTLSALPVFFRQYDPDFFAQEIPCSFDYPLCQPVPDSRAGVEYILDYLRRWLLESSFLRAFPADAMIELYERYYVDYEDLLVNLYQPAAEMAVLCALADEPVRVLWMEKDRFEIVRRVFTQASEYAARQELLKAADRTLNDCGITGTAPRDYLNETALNLIVRLRAAFAANGADQEGMQNRLWISERSF